MKLESVALMMTIAIPLMAVAQAPTPAQPPAQRQAAANQARGQATNQERVYGSQLMTDAERAEYHAKMRALKTPEERQAFRLEHHKLMQERAKERGVTLPDMPMMQGKGQGMGQGMNQGMHQGMGKGMGQKGMGPAAGDQTPPQSDEGATSTPKP